MHVGWALVFDVLPEGGTPSLGRVQELIDRRLQLLPRFRYRLSGPRAGERSWPSWEPDSRFDVANHVGRATLPEPGGEDELLDWLGDFYSHRLDRARPLWEMTLLDGLAGGSWAIASKVHHSLIDGLRGTSVTAAILDAEPHPDPDSMGLLAQLEAGEEEEDRQTWLAALAGTPQGGPDAAGRPSKLDLLLDRSRAIAEELIGEVVPAPHTSLNVDIGTTRQLAAVHTSLDELCQVRSALGGTIDDVILAATAGGLRRLFAARGEELEDESVRALAPGSVRRASEQLALGKCVSSLFVDLPVAEPDPLQRFRKTVSASREVKEASRARHPASPVELAGTIPPVIHGAVARLAFTPRLVHLTITNVSGVQVTLYAMGAPLRRIVPLVPIFSGHAVGIAVVSYDGRVAFGINADRREVPDVGVLRDGIEQSLAELELLATGAAGQAA